MSEVIENYIRRHPGLSEKDAFEGFLQEERIKSWVGADESRKDRLRKEFGRTWGSLHADTAPSHTARAGPSGPTMQQPRSVRVESTQARPEPAPLPAPGAVSASSTSSHAGSHATGGGRRLQVMCTNCKRTDVWLGDDHDIRCRHCHMVYHDMLQLVRVQPVGPLAFYFGEGWKGAAIAGGIVAGLAALYLFLRWL